MASSRPSDFTLTKPGPLRIYSMTELLKLPPPTWLIRKVIPSGGLVGIYGAPGHYKSFVAVDMAMCVATGMPWQGNKARKEHVLYVAAEGGVGMVKRALGWLIHHDVPPAHADINWLTESVPVAIDSENMDTLFGRIDNEIRKQPGLIIIDTLARCFDGDENQQEDMGRFVGGIDRLRREYDATVLVVHHSRLDASRERGSTAFRGAADAMVFVRKPADGEAVVSCDKQKDDEHFAELQLSMQKVVLPLVDEEGDQHTTVVPTFPARERDEEILNWLAVGALTFTELKDRAKGSPGQGPVMSPAALKRRLVSLVKKGKIIKENGVYQENRVTKVS